ncbi:MAG: hypothetical protein ACE5GV_10345 [Candidatus Scalindua sp.]
MYLDTSVVNYSRDSQHPQYGRIRHPKLDKGDFIFVLDENNTVDTPPPEEQENIEDKKNTRK